MVKSVLGVNHQGLRDWVVQRLSAVYMAVYTIALAIYFFLQTGLSVAQWQQLFAPTWMKVATVLFFLSLMLHAWIGMWTILTDYVKPFVLRAVLDVVVMLTLMACFIWALMILWSV